VTSILTLGVNAGQPPGAREAGYASDVATRENVTPPHEDEDEASTLDCPGPL